MRNPQGYAEIFNPGIAVEEHDTVTCIHCGQVGMTKSSLSGIPEVLVYRPDGTHYLREAGFCRSCMNYTCGRKCCIECNNRFRKLEQEEKTAWKLIWN